MPMKEVDVAAPPATGGAIGQAGSTRWQRSAESKRELAKDIVWLTHEPLAFLLRRGGHYDDEAELYERMYQPENLKRMADAGVRFGRVFFYKGFGLEYERPDMDRSKRAADIMHSLGMKVSIYMAGTMFVETLYREIPEAEGWEQRDQDNKWVPYGGQTFRHYACPNEPAYREYLKRILKIGIKELRADEVAFDNLMLQGEPKSCRCPRCIAAFRAFLKRKYPTREAVMRRFGLPDVDWIRVHEWASPAQAENINVLNDPVLQEWVRFRCESLAGHVRDLYDYVKKLNPNVVVHINIKGIYSFNRYWTAAVYHPLYAGHVDVLSFDTGGYDAQLHPATGALISQVRSYKMARLLGASCDAGWSDLEVALHMAFGVQTTAPTFVGSPYLPHKFTPILEFFREHLDRYYKGAENVADVAVLRNWPSMAYSITDTWAETTLLEQVLIQHKVPFDLLHEEYIDRIGRYGAVVMAGQECVSNAQADVLLDYVRKGGNLVLTGNTGKYNEWREERRVNPLLPSRTEGKGRIIHIPDIIAGTPKPLVRTRDDDPEPGHTLHKGQPLSTKDWVLPANHTEIYHTVLGALPEGLSIVTDAPLTTVMELVNRPEKRETLVHFVNFDQQTAPNTFDASIRRQYAAGVASVVCFSPEWDEPVKLSFSESNGQVKFTVPATPMYSMVVITHKQPAARKQVAGLKEKADAGACGL
jgi:hypothetical protein